MAIYGANVSEYETVSNVSQLINGGPHKLDYFIFRANKGMKDDGNYTQNRLIAVNNFALRGTFVWFDPNPALPDPWAQAHNYFLRINSAGKEFNIPGAFDIEPAPGTTLPAASIWVPKIVDACQQWKTWTGRYPILYSNISTFHDYLQVQTNPVLKLCPLWIAWPSVNPPVITGYTANWAMWQNVLGGSYPGITGSIDGINIWPTTVEDMLKWCNDPTFAIPKLDITVHTCPAGQHWDGTQCVPDVVPPPTTDLTVRVTALEQDIKNLRTALGPWVNKV